MPGVIGAASSKGAGVTGMDCIGPGVAGTDCMTQSSSGVGGSWCQKSSSPFSGSSSSSPSASLPTSSPSAGTSSPLSSVLIIGVPGAPAASAGVGAAGVAGTLCITGTGVIAAISVPAKTGVDG